MSGKQIREDVETTLEVLWAKRPDIHQYWTAHLRFGVYFTISQNDPDIKTIVNLLPLTKKGKWWVLE